MQHLFLSIHPLKGIWFTLVSIMDSSVINMGMYVPSQIPVFTSFPYRLGSGLLGSRVDLFYIFLRNLYLVFHSVWTGLHSYEQCKGLPFTSPSPTSVVSYFIISW